MSDTDVARFGTAPEAGCSAPQMDYPLDRAVMPRNVYPPKIMWTPRHSAQGTDLYRVRLVRPNAVLEGYFLAAHAWQPLVDDFRPLANANLGTPIQLTVTVLTQAGLCDQGAITFRTVDAYIAGSVYYWSPPLAKLIRVDPDAARLVDFLPNPGGCIACHAVTRDGRRLAATMGDPSVVAYDLTRNLTGSPPPTIFPPESGLGERIMSFNGDGTRLLLSVERGGEFLLRSGTTGVAIAASGLGTVAGTDPEWSPDSSAVAYTNAGNLALLPSMPGDQFGAPVVIHQGASAPGGSVDWHPTWSPDSQWLVFQHGDTELSGDRSGSRAGALWLISRTGSGAVPLSNLNGGRTDNWRPVFSPFDSGGYFWVLFTTKRPYGNQLAGVQGQKQIWIAAIRDQPAGLADPSEVPYYMDGQEAVTNLSPYWAPAPCQVNAGSCTADYECCSGKCANGTCAPSAACRMRGESCSTTGDCCSRLECRGNLCDLPVVSISAD